MKKKTIKQRNIELLEAKGWREDTTTQVTKYTVYSKPGVDYHYYLGRSGACRRGRTVGESLPVKLKIDGDPARTMTKTAVIQEKDSLEGEQRPDPQMAATSPLPAASYRLPATGAPPTSCGENPTSKDVGNRNAACSPPFPNGQPTSVATSPLAAVPGKEDEQRPDPTSVETSGAESSGTHVTAYAQNASTSPLSAVLQASIDLMALPTPELLKVRCEDPDQEMRKVAHHELVRRGYTGGNQMVEAHRKEVPA